MKKYNFSIVITQGEDGFYMGEVPALSGCHTQAKTVPLLLERMQEAIELYMEVQKLKKKDVFQTKFIEVQNLEVTI